MTRVIEARPQVGLQVLLMSRVSAKERNTTIPTKKTVTLTTCRDFQQSVSLAIFEGERANSKAGLLWSGARSYRALVCVACSPLVWLVVGCWMQENQFLGDFVIDNLPPMHRGVPQIEVTFEIDATRNEGGRKLRKNGDRLGPRLNDEPE